MANIIEHLKKILSARKGEEVRSSIHDSIKAMNDQIENDLGGMIEDGNEVIEAMQEEIQSVETMKENGELNMKPEDLTEAQWANLKSDLTNYYKRYESIYTTTQENETNIPINISQYSTLAILEVYIEGRMLNRNEYAINGTNSITLNIPLSEIGTKVHFIVYRSVCASNEDLNELKGPKGDSGAIVFNTVAEMIADEDLVTGDSCQTLGYYSANDGGAGLYKIVDNDTLIDDGGSIHNLTNGLKAQLIIKNGSINVNQFGANKNNADNSQYLINAFNYAMQKNYIVTFPKGIFKVKQSLGEYYNIKIQGVYSGASSYWHIQTAIYDEREETNDYLLTLGQYNSSIKNIIFRGIDNKNTCLHMKEGWKNKVENLSFINFLNALKVSGNDTTYENIFCIDCGSNNSSSSIRYAIEDIGLENLYSHLHIEHCRFMMKTSNYTTITNSKFEVSTQYIEYPATSLTEQGKAYFDLAKTIFSNNECIMLAMDAYLEYGYSESSSPYMIYADDCTISSNYFITGIGSGGHSITPNSRTARFIRYRRTTVNNNIFKSIVRRTTALYGTSESIFLGNIIYYTGDETLSTNYPPSADNTCIIRNNQYISRDGIDELYNFSTNPEIRDVVYSGTYRNITASNPLTLDMPGAGYFIGLVRVYLSGVAEMVITYIVSRSGGSARNLTILSNSDTTKWNNYGFSIEINSNNKIVIATTNTNNWTIDSRLKVLDRLW